jgi:hypothetical protein
MGRAVTTAIVATCLVLVVISTCCKKDQQPVVPVVQPSTTTPAVEPALPATERRSLWSEAEEKEIMENIKTKLVPRQFEFINGTDRLVPHQFLHQHHMKTGGTSMDHIIKCAVERLEKSKSWQVPYYNIHECAQSNFKKCVANETSQCRGMMNKSAVISYCAPLKYLDTLGWTEENIQAMTVLRDPVSRVWSMFRFQTKKCFHCMNLTDIYDLIDTNQTEDAGFPSPSLCLGQLQNHESANLLSSEFDDDATEDDMVEEAIHNMKTFYSVVGLTERLTETYELLGEVFPWMAMEIEGSSTVCRLPHANSSPKNNYCIPNPSPDPKQWQGLHWDLPDQPDEETRKAIEAHNQMDMRLYEAAVQYFELQMRAAEMGEES